MQRHRELAAASLTEVLVDGILEATPVEGGHAHEAWSQAAEDAASRLPVGGERVKAIVSRHSGKASGDQNARAEGFGMVDEELHQLTVRIENALPFVSVLEYGGTLEPISPGGTKAGGIATMGQYLAPRTAGTAGWLMWITEGGTIRFARTRTFRSGGFVKQALRTTAMRARRLGGKVITA